MFQETVFVSMLCVILVPLRLTPLGVRGGAVHTGSGHKVLSVIESKTFYIICSKAQ